jgi:MYXO-CTERM domain-containing protein
VTPRRQIPAGGWVLVPCLWLTSLCGCDGGAAADGPVAVASRAIRGGIPDDSLAAVAALTDDSGIFCSAALIAPGSAALTAAHCLLGHDHPALLLSQPGGGTSIIHPVRVRIHPRYADGSGPDLALLFLGAAATSVPADLAATAPSPGTEVEIAGFGRGDVSTRPGVRRSGRARVRNLDGPFLDLDADPQSPCYGDSGGAVLVGAGGRTLAGIIVSGDESCQEVGRAVRVDATLADFIEPLLTAPSAGGGGIGDSCSRDLDCARGYCTTSPNAGWCTASCAPSDTTACSPGFACSPAATGAPGIFECRRTAPGGCQVGPVMEGGAPGAILGLLALAWASLRSTRRV